jgi:threonine synthase
MDYPAVAFRILNEFIGREIQPEILGELCRDAYNFPVPVEKGNGNDFILRLDQGPTASFKDFAARMMARLMQHFLSAENRHLTIITATSGDTGSAVASAFLGLQNIKVIILFPANEVTSLQRKQMTTLKDNIRVLSVNGKFDDCQRLVKTAFRDNELSSIPLSSANSINIGRLLPQSVYYFHAWSVIAVKSSEPVIFSVPSGNFGNLMGGVLARQMGLPVRKFVISTNENDEVPAYLRSGTYKPIVPSRNCISSAMNVGHPSNLSRLVTLYGGIMDEKGVILKLPDLDRMRRDFFTVSISDDETRETIRSCWNDSGLLLEPHGAVAWRGLKEYRNQFPGDKSKGIVLETAHPSKFREEMMRIINHDPELHYALEGLENEPEEFLTIENDYPELKEYIRRNAYRQF